MSAGVQLHLSNKAHLVEEVREPETLVKHYITSISSSVISVRVLAEALSLSILSISQEYGFVQ